MDWFLYDNGLHHERVNIIPRLVLEIVSYVKNIIRQNVSYEMILSNLKRRERKRRKPKAEIKKTEF